jgi:hypothetical protein
MHGILAVLGLSSRVCLLRCLASDLLARLHNYYISDKPPTPPKKKSESKIQYHQWRQFPMHPGWCRVLCIRLHTSLYQSRGLSWDLLLICNSPLRQIFGITPSSILLVYPSYLRLQRLSIDNIVIISAFSKTSLFEFWSCHLIPKFFH